MTVILSRKLDAAGIQAMRDEAFRAAEAVDERHFTTEALEGCIKDFARYIVDLTDGHALLSDVAHRAWHLMDESVNGAVLDNGVTEYLHSGVDHQRLSDALDAVEAEGWKGCDD